MRRIRGNALAIDFGGMRFIGNKRLGTKKHRDTDRNVCATFWTNKNFPAIFISEKNRLSKITARNKFLDQKFITVENPFGLNIFFVKHKKSLSLSFQYLNIFEWHQERTVLDLFADKVKFLMWTETLGLFKNLLLNFSFHQDTVKFFLFSHFCSSDFTISSGVNMTIIPYPFDKFTALNALIFEGFTRCLKFHETMASARAIDACATCNASSAYFLVIIPAFIYSSCKLMVSSVACSLRISSSLIISVNNSFTGTGEPNLAP